MRFNNLSSEEAYKELRLFAYLGLLSGLIGLIVFWPLAVAGLAFSTRGLLLLKYTSAESTPLMAVSIVGLLVSAISVILAVLI